MQLTFEPVNNIEVLEKAVNRIKTTLKPYGIDYGIDRVDFSTLTAAARKRGLKYGLLTKKDVRG